MNLMIEARDRHRRFTPQLCVLHRKEDKVLVHCKLAEQLFGGDIRFHLSIEVAYMIMTGVVAGSGPTKQG